MPRRIVDTHHHLCSARYVDYIKERLKGMPPYVEQVLRAGTPAKSLEDMDRAGVARAFMSLTTPGVWFGDVAEARRLARQCNEDFARFAADHPGRYGVFAAVPMPDVDGTLAEIEYALDSLKLDGIGFFTSYNDTYLGDPRFAPVFAELDRRKAVVYTHPRRPDACAGLLPDISEAVIEYGTDTTRTIASLVFSGTAAKTQDVTYLFSHAGGTMPFLIGRFIGLAERYKDRLPHGLMHELTRFYYDLAQAANSGATSSLMQLVAVSQVLFGTDYPYATAAQHLEGLMRCGFAEDALDAVLGRNAERILPRART